MASNIHLSDVVQNLDSVEKERYFKKLDIVGTNDPYTLPISLFKSIQNCSKDELPDLLYPDIYNYLINCPSPYTGESLKNYKNLEFLVDFGKI